MPILDDPVFVQVVTTRGSRANTISHRLELLVPRTSAQLRLNLIDAESVWSSAALRKLQVATAATSLGKWAFALSLGVYAYREGGTAAIGIAALVRTFPATIAAPVFGLASDHFPRQRVLAVTNGLRALILVGIAFAVLGGAPLVVVFLLAAVFSTVSTANQPARAALIPVLARSPQELASSMSIMGSIDAFSFLVGAGFGGVMLASTSVEFLLALDREPFLASVTGYAGSHAAALDVAEGFLEPVESRV